MEKQCKKIFDSIQIFPKKTLILSIDLTNCYFGEKILNNFLLILEHCNFLAMLLTFDGESVVIVNQISSVETKVDNGTPNW